MPRIFQIVGLVLILLVAVACDRSAPRPLLSPHSSPVSPLGTPGTRPTLHPNFRLDPIAQGATEVTGQGPVGFTLVIVDVTYGGEYLGAAQPDAQGNFHIRVTQPLEGGHLIGLTVDLLEEQLRDEALNRQLFEIRGKGYRFVPNLVTVFDSYEVK
jgi:hypothetical protein